MIVIKELSSIQIELSNTSILCFSKFDYYILDALVLNGLIIKQGVSEFLNFPVVEHRIQFTSFYARCLKVLWICSVVGT